MKLSWSQLEALLGGLDQQLFHGKLDVPTYMDEWDKVMDFAGWTWHEFVVEVDNRWTPQKKAESPLFRC